jgi:hypothetical protein
MVPNTANPAMIVAPTTAKLMELWGTTGPQQAVHALRMQLSATPAT